jgi:hypothetical protein
MAIAETDTMFRQEIAKVFGFACGTINEGNTNIALPTPRYAFADSGMRCYCNASIRVLALSD